MEEALDHLEIRRLVGIGYWGCQGENHPLFQMSDVTWHRLSGDPEHERVFRVLGLKDDMQLDERDRCCWFDAAALRGYGAA